MGGIGAPELLLLLVIPILIFFAIRGLLLWYWKVYEIIKNQETQNDLLARQNQLIEEQTSLLKELNARLAGTTVDPKKQNHLI